MAATAQSISTAPATSDGIPDVPIYRLTVEQYHAMARAGILDEDAPVELLEGWLVQKMTKHRPHSRCTLRTRRALEQALSTGWYVDTQEPITMIDSEPEPDVLVVRGDEADYLDRQPGAADVPFVIEVADTTLSTDRGAKKRTYARAGIPIYWIINLPERLVEVYSDPTGPAAEPDYRHRRNYTPEDSVPIVLDGVEAGCVKVSELLP